MMGEIHTRRMTRGAAPAAEPLTLAEAKLYLRVDGGAEDALIADMLTTVREAAEGYLGKSLMTQGWVMTYQDYAPSCVPLAKGPVQSVESVVTRDRNGNATTLLAARYHLSPVEDALHLDAALMAHAIEVHYTVGYGDADDVPSSVRQGMLVHLAALYEDRLGGMTIPPASVTLYAPHREVRLA